MNWGTKVTATTKCPECGNDLVEYVKPDNSTLIRCSDFPTCKYKISLI